MLCIAAFLVLIVLATFSARHRRMLSRAWGCTVRRVTLRPCDTSFGQDLKDGLLAPVAVWRPGLVRPASIAIEVGALLIVLVSVWSLYVVAKGGLNLWVYGTCDKADPQSCSLGAEACSIGDLTPSMLDSLLRLDIIGAIGNEIADVADTIGAIPDRLRTWDATAYVPPNATWRTGLDPTRPTALEVVDPGCSVCAQLAANIVRAGVAERYNLSYVAYPIPGPLGTRFPNSGLVVRYLEALRLHVPEVSGAPLDWQLLERILTGTDPAGRPWQDVLNEASREEATTILQGWLAELGLDRPAIDAVASTAGSAEVDAIVESNMTLVREGIGTRKIPTLIIDGGRRDGLVSVDDLR
jgi:hypothetical protein